MPQPKRHRGRRVRPHFTSGLTWVPDFRQRFLDQGFAPESLHSLLQPQGAGRNAPNPHDYAEALVEQAWLEVPLDDSWIAAYRLAVQQGQPVIAELRIFPSAGDPWPRPGMGGRWNGALRGPHATVPRGGLSARLLRRARVGEHFGAGMAFIDWLKRQPGGDWAAEYLPQPTDEGQRSRRRAAARPDIVLARFARQYVDAVHRDSRKPVEDVARANKESVSAMRMMIYRARRRGLLSQPPAGGQGQKGGLLTPKASRLLGDVEKKGGKAK